MAGPPPDFQLFSNLGERAPGPPGDSSYLFTADAQAILDESKSLDEGLNLLRDAYSAKTWDDPQSASETASSYATQLRQKFNDQSTYQPSELGKVVPINFDDVQGEGDDELSKRLDQVNKYEQANKEFLNSTTDPDYLLVKDKLTKSIEGTATNLRRLARTEDRSAFSNAVQDMFFRSVEASTGGIAKLFGADDYVKSLKERTDPSYDDDLSSMFLSGLANVGAGTAVTMATGPIGGYAYFTAQGAGEVRNTFKESEEATGDTTRAYEAAGIEGIAQGLQIYGASRLVKGGIAGLEKLLGKTTAQAVLKNAGVQIATESGVQAGIAGVSTIMGNAATRVGKNTNEVGYFDNTGKSVAVGAGLGFIFGMAGAGKGQPNAQTPPTLEEPLAGEAPSNVENGSNKIGDVQAPKQDSNFDLNAFQLKNAKGRKQVLEQELANLSKEDGDKPLGDSGYTERTAREAQLNKVNEEIAKLEGKQETTLKVEAPDPLIVNNGQPPTIETNKIGAIPNSKGTQNLLTDTKPIDQPSFVTEDGNIYVTHPEGNTSRTKTSSQEEFHPLDRTFYLNEETAARVAALRTLTTPDGQPVVAVTNGSDLFLKSEYVNPDLTLSETPTGNKLVRVPKEDVAAAGLYPMEVNQAKNINGADKEYRSHLGARISEVRTPTRAPESLPETSTVGAQSVYEGTSARKLGERLSGSETIPKELQDLITGSQGTLLRYQVKPNIETVNAAGEVIATKGVAQATEEFLSLPETHASPETMQVGAQLLESYSTAYEAAKAENNTFAAATASELYEQVAHQLGRLSTNIGQSLQIQRVLAEQHPLMAVNAIKEKLNAKAIEEVSRETGQSIEDLHKVPEQLKSIQEKIDALKNEGEVTKTPEGKEEVKLSEEQQNTLSGLEAEEKAYLDLQSKLAEAKREKQENFTEDDQNKLIRFKKAKSILPENSSQAKKLEKGILDIERKAEGKEITPSTAKQIFSYWIGNKLLSLGTQAGSLKGNLFQTLGNVQALAIMSPKQLGAFFRGFAQAIPEALHSSKEILKGNERIRAGRSYGMYNDFVKTGPPIIRLIGYAMRGLAAGDEFFYRTNKEGAAAALLDFEGRTPVSKGGKGLTGEALREFIDNALGNSRASKEAAYREAEQYASTLKEAGIELTKGEVQTLAYEIADKNLSEVAESASHRIGAFTTFTDTPSGFIGELTKRIAAVPEAPMFINGQKIQPIKYDLPFFNFGGNAVNALLDYTFNGLVKSGYIQEGYYYTKAKLKGETPTEYKSYDTYTDHLGRVEKVEKHLLQRRLEAGRTLAAYGAAGLIYGIVKAFQHDENPYIDLTGPGPRKPSQRQAWKNNKGIPWSLRVGDTQFKISDIPQLGPLLAAIGAVQDAYKWDRENYDEQTMVNTIGMAVAAMGTSIFNNTYFQNIADLLDTFQNPETARGFSQIGASFLQDFVPFSGAMRTVSKMFDDPIETRKDFNAKLVAGIPVVESLVGRPALNRFGEPVKRNFSERIDFLSRFFTQRETDPNWRWLTENGYTIPNSSTVTVDLNLDKGNKAEERLRESRAAQFGRQYSNVLTPEETYAFVKETGPKIKAVVERYRNRYGTSAFQQSVQKQLNEDISEIDKLAKRKILSRSRP